RRQPELRDVDHLDPVLPLGRRSDESLVHPLQTDRELLGRDPTEDGNEVDVTDAGFEVSGRHRTEHVETDEGGCGDRLDPAADRIHDGIDRRLQYRVWPGHRSDRTPRYLIRFKSDSTSRAAFPPGPPVMPPPGCAPEP